MVELVALLAWSVILYQAGDGLQILFANALRGISDVKYMAYMAFFCRFRTGTSHRLPVRVHLWLGSHRHLVRLPDQPDHFNSDCYFGDVSID